MKSFLFALSLLCLLLLVPASVHGNPISRPYIALRTDPYDAEHKLEFPDDKTVSTVTRWDRIAADAKCPLQFSLGISKRWHRLEHTAAFGIRQPAVVQTVFPAAGPGRSVLYTTRYEHFDVLSPAPPSSSSGDSSSSSSVMREALIQHPEYPWLWESSAFHAGPLVHDVNADGIADVVLADYDGGIYMRGLAGVNGDDGNSDKRYSHHAQVPRLYVRRQWVEGRVREVLHRTAATDTDTVDNATDPHADDLNDPYHSYFEYYYGDEHKDGELLRGVTAHHLGHDSAQAEGLQSRRKRHVSHKRREEEEEMEQPEGVYEQEEHLTNQHEHGEESLSEEEREAEVFAGEALHEQDEMHRRRLEEIPPPDDMEPRELTDDIAATTADDLMLGGKDDDEDDELMAFPKDDDYDRLEMEEREMMLDDDFRYEEMMDDIYGHRYDDYMMGYHDRHNDYYDEAHYIRIPPHILCTPVVAELPRTYGDTNEKDEVLLVAVSYYFDEDEYEGHRSYKRFKATDTGDETEVKRGQYVASAIMSYNLGEFGRWGSQTHLDLSTDASAPENATMVGDLEIMEDVTHMSAFALSTPTVADIDGDGSYEVLVGTSMGFIYAVDARHLFTKNFWPFQMPFPVESQILVEDVIGDTKLELFAADVGGNVACLSHDGKVLWSRNVLRSLKETDKPNKMSPLMLGDVDGDGSLDVVVSVQIRSNVYVFVVNAVTGKDVANFPLLVEVPHENMKENDPSIKLPAPLLVDLHAEQDFLLKYIRRNGTAYHKPSRADRKAKTAHGGDAGGLHVVQPVESDLYIIEGGSGCTQQISIGDRVSSMVQVEDVHGTGRLDLVIATESGNTITLESGAPYHPLNTWGGGGSRPRGTHAHGYSASQGIYVHEISRQYVDIFGVYVPVTFEIFDNRPGIASEPEKRKYLVEIRDGPSSKRALLRGEYTSTGVYTERVYIRYGPGYYNLHVVMTTSHGLIYQDSFAIGYNVHFLDGFGILLWLPLCVASITIVLCGAKRTNWEDEDYEDTAREGATSLGILGRSLPS